jgi:hypothetical protein
MSVRIRQWSAWTSGEPDMSEILPLLRRRMSRLTRMSVAVALDCCRRANVSASEVPIVFASRHGEMGATVDLLGQLAAGETLSPMNFSGSVHHTALGYLSIAAANKSAARAVAGGEASFCYGFLDAIGLLAETHGSAVLLVAADDEVPPPFANLSGTTNLPYATAFLLERSSGHKRGVVSLEMPSRRLSSKQSAPRANALGIPALDFLRWFLKEKKPLEWHLSDRIWRWKK